MVKYHFYLHPDIKSALPPEELHMEGSDVDQVLVADYFLNDSTNIFK